MSYPDIVYVDENDNVIGHGPMQDAWEHGHIHRIARLFVFNSKGEFLLQKRSMNHKNMPGRWDNSAAGHADVGEDYHTAVLREAEEEIGVSGISVTEVCHYFQDESEPGMQKKRFNTLYTSVYDGNVTADLSEVSETRWIAVPVMEKWMNETPSDFAPGFLEAFRRYKLTSEGMLRSEGFVHVFDWTDAPGAVYEPHAHKDKVTIFTTKGSVDFTINNQTLTFRAGDRYDVPPGVVHSAVVGPDGWSCIVGEMIPGDS